MARGWESKSVEEQMAEQEQTGAQHGSSLNEAERHQKALEEAGRRREKQNLELQRENILSQRTSNPARREALAAALHQIEAQIKALE
jgi:hypothetical protein